MFGALVYKFNIVQSFFDYHIHDPVKKSHIRSRLMAEVYSGYAGKLDITRVCHNKFRITGFYTPADNASYYRMTFGCVGTDNEKQVCLCYIRDRITHCTFAKGCLGAGYRRCMAETSTMVNIVGTDNRPGEFLYEIIFLIGKFCRTEYSDTIRPAFSHNIHYIFSNHVKCFIPARFTENVLEIAVNFNIFSIPLSPDKRYS